MTSVNRPEVARGKSGTSVDAVQVLAQGSSREVWGSRSSPSNKTRATAECAAGKKRPGAVFIVELESCVMTMRATGGGSACGPLRLRDTIGVEAEDTGRYGSGREGVGASRGLTSASQSEGPSAGPTGCAIWALGSSGWPVRVAGLTRSEASRRWETGRALRTEQRACRARHCTDFYGHDA